MPVYEHIEPGLCDVCWKSQYFAKYGDFTITMHITKAGKCFHYSMFEEMDAEDHKDTDKIKVAVPVV